MVMVRLVTLAMMIVLFTIGEILANQAILSWDAPTTNTDGTLLTDLSGYKLYFGTSSGQYSQIIDVGLANPDSSSINGRQFTVFGLEPGKIYFFVVTAYDTTGNESGFSNEVFKLISFDTIPPQDVLGFTATAGNATIRLSWTNPPNPDFLGVIIRYRNDGFPISSVDGNPVARLTSRPGEKHTYDHTGLTNGLTYYYSIHTYDTSGNITNTAKADAILPSVGTSINNSNRHGGGCGMIKNESEGGGSSPPFDVLSFFIVLLTSFLVIKLLQWRLRRKAIVY